MIKHDISKILRAIAIFIVMLSHYATWMYIPAANEALRYRISTWGPFGVDIFFLMSGYGLYFSASTKKRPGILFILKRLITVYLPYLAIVFVIMLVNGDWKGITGEEIVEYLIGYNYWYIEILLIFYLLFFVIWSLFKDDRLRLPTISIGIIAVSFVFHRIGYKDFWVVSNIAFIVGIFAAFCEKRCSQSTNLKKEMQYERRTEESPFWHNKITVVLISLAGLSGFVISDIIYLRILENNPLGGFKWECLMNLFFSVFILGCGYLLEMVNTHKEAGIIVKALNIIGGHSLYIYIMHQSLFWTMIFAFIKLGFIAASIVVAILSIIICCGIGYVFNKYVCDKILGKLGEITNKR